MPARTERQEISGRRLLVVDDNLINQKVAVKVLTRLGYEVEVAGDGAEALTLFGRGAFDAILMDCQMPVMDGYQAVAAIREREAASGATIAIRVPIIALTANALGEERARCLDGGMDDFLTKPIQADELEEVLRRLLPQAQEKRRPPQAQEEAPLCRQ